MTSSPAPVELLERIEAAEGLDRIADPLRDAVRRVPRRASSILRGDWLGHPLHPLLTDLPIGFWTTSWVLDLTVPKRAARTSTAMVGLGVATAVPTMAAGLVDWADLPREKRRSGLALLGMNVVATVAYTSSFRARISGHRRRGIALGMLGAALATGSGYVGGHLVFGSAGGDEADADAADLTGDDQVRATAAHLQGAGSTNGDRTVPVLGA